MKRLDKVMNMAYNLLDENKINEVEAKANENCNIDELINFIWEKVMEG